LQAGRVSQISLKETIMSKLIDIAIAAALAFTANVAAAQNVKSDQDQAQGQERTMEHKEKAGQSSDAQSAPSPENAQAAMRCKGKNEHEMQECMENQSMHDHGAASEERRDEHHKRSQ
jgi:hypothetical protein